MRRFEAKNARLRSTSAAIAFLLIPGCLREYPNTWDQDGDGVGNAVDCDPEDPSVHSFVDEDRDGFTCEQDCWEGNPDVNPDALEICDGVDSDCDGDLPSTEADLDGDGYVECSIPEGTQVGEAVLGGGDCDDARERSTNRLSWSPSP